VTYSVPAQAINHELEEKRSRFITFIEPVASRADAMSFLAQLRLRFPDASHHCWAFVLGNPYSPSEMACSDDGEPSGSAGKPMLQILQYREVGDVMAVVVRYFGGTKLGVGGLVRAYGAAVQQAIEKTPLLKQVAKVSVNLKFDYAFEANIRHLLRESEGEIISCDYTECVTMQCLLEEKVLSDLRDSINNLTQGKAVIRGDFEK